MLAACALAAALSAVCLSPDAFAPLGLAPVTGPAAVAAAPDVSRRLLPTPAAPDAYDPDGRRSSPDRDPAPGPGPGAPADTPDLTGVYRFTTRDFDGKTSAGVAIVERVVDAYSVRWATTGGGTVSGFGLRVGDVLAVTWQMTATVEVGGETVQKAVRGLTLYRVESDGRGKVRLRGRWVVSPGDGRVRDEEMVRIGDVPRADGDDGKE